MDKRFNEEGKTQTGIFKVVEFENGETGADRIVKNKIKPKTEIEEISWEENGGGERIVRIIVKEEEVKRNSRNKERVNVKAEGGVERNKK